jgi:hypothetical protein
MKSYSAEGGVIPFKGRPFTKAPWSGSASGTYENEGDGVCFAWTDVIIGDESTCVVTGATVGPSQIVRKPKTTTRVSAAI